MIIQEGIHQLLVMSLNFMSKVISGSGKLNERRNKLVIHDKLT